MFMFILTMSCLTTSNFPWFGDLTFQVSKQYSSWQHQIFLLSPNTWKTKCCICFGPATSFIRGLLVILLYSSPVAYRTPSDPGDSPFAAIPLWTFIQLMRFSQKVDWGGLPFLLQWITFCQNSLLWPMSWVALHGMAHSFIELHKPLCHQKAVILEGD